jgi:hypothetical protein
LSFCLWQGFIGFRYSSKATRTIASVVSIFVSGSFWGKGHQLRSIHDLLTDRILQILIPSLMLNMALFAPCASGQINESLPEEAIPVSALLNENFGVDPIRSVFLLPGESLIIEPETTEDFNEKFTLDLTAGELADEGRLRWRWVAPKKVGLYPIHISMGEGETFRELLIQAFVMVPYKKLKGEYLNGYRIGRYPRTNDETYQHPRGFIEVDEDNQDTQVSSHFKLGQFLCKQGGGWPKYLVLKERLLSKLEQILSRAAEQGYRWTGFHIMSGYRTPYHNRRLGNVRYSRHMWGDAADLLVDHNPADGAMDDVNGDGKIDVADTHALRDIVNSMEKEQPEVFPVGGLGIYSRNRHHGPFVHVDTRGTPARWGNRYRMAQAKRRKLLSSSRRD